MKMCLNCSRMNREEEEFCVECGQNEFEEILFPVDREREEE